MVLITHKLHEVLEISNRVAILRKGEVCGYGGDKGCHREPADRDDGGAEGGAEYPPVKAGESQKTSGDPRLTVYSREGVKVLG